MNITNLIMIAFVVWHLIVYTKRAVKIINNNQTNEFVLGGIIAFVLHYGFIIYGFFFYHWS